MSSEAQPEPATAGSIQFDRADFVQPAEGPLCAVCGRSLQGHYFEVNGAMVCEGCRYSVETAFQQRGGLGGFVKAAGAGFGAAVAGSILYYLVREVTGLEIGLISILVGWGVGKSVRWGSKAKGGWVYQSLAIFLTYMAIVSTYLPAIFQQISARQGRERPAATAPAQAAGAAAVPGKPANPAQPAARKPARESVTFGQAMLGLGAILLLAAAIPFLAGAKNLIGLLIIGFGLWEAWKHNRRTELAISGPFRVGTAAGDAPTGS